MVSKYSETSHATSPKIVNRASGDYVSYHLHVFSLIFRIRNGHIHLDHVCIPSSYDSRLQSDREASAAATKPSSSSSSSNRPDLWSEPTAFGERAHFRASASPAVLSVTGVQRFDAGTFMCRVDFRQSPTVYHTVELDVIGERGESEYRIV